MQTTDLIAANFSSDAKDLLMTDDAGALVRPPSQASRHMDLADVTALAQDRIMAASLGAPLADDDDTPSIARLDIEDAARALVAGFERTSHVDVRDLTALIEAVRGTGGAR